MQSLYRYALITEERSGILGYTIVKQYGYESPKDRQNCYSEVAKNNVAVWLLISDNEYLTNAKELGNCECLQYLPNEKHIDNTGFKVGYLSLLPLHKG